MATDFPTSLDSLTNPTSSDTLASVPHATQHANANDAVEALQTKVGADSSSVTSSLDYKLKNTSSSDPGHKHTLANGATDVTASTAELNKMDGVTSSTAEINLLDGKTMAGADATILTGTAGTDGDLAQWNADGDLVDSKTPPTGDIVGHTDTQTLTNKTLGASTLSGNMNVGTYTITNAYIASPVIQTGISGTAVKDEDDMSSDSTTHIATQQSIKAYSDNSWIPAGETWTFGADDDPTYTFTIGSFDATTKYSAGMRLKLTDSGTQYFIVTKVVFDDPGSTITVYGGTTYDLSGGAITSPFYAYVKAPLGFPLSPENWMIETKDETNATQATPTSNTWYNLGSITINVPIGIWRVYYQLVADVNDNSAGVLAHFATLSTANNSESDSEWTIFVGVDLDDATPIIQVPYFRENFLTLTTKDTYYLNSKTNVAGMNEVSFRGDVSPTIIRAICAYL